LVLRNPSPSAVFTAFGETTMTFELRIYVADIVNGGGVRNDLRLEIFERFRAEGIGLPFPKDVIEDTPVIGLPEAPEHVPAPPETDTGNADETKPGATPRRPRRVGIASSESS
jgi:potassium-dependent mechanosensitive channel